MELSKKTTILFSPKSHRQLTDLAERRGVSLGELVREACATAYGIVDQEASVAAVAAALEIPDARTERPQSRRRPSVHDIPAILRGEAKAA